MFFERKKIKKGSAAVYMQFFSKSFKRFYFCWGIAIFVVAAFSCSSVREDFGASSEAGVALDSIRRYEKEGDYSRALTILRKTLEKCASREKTLLDWKGRLEEKVLRQGHSCRLFDAKGRPRAKLLRLLKIVGMEGDLDAMERPLEQINAWAQKNLLRQGERWERQTSDFEPLKSEIVPLLKALGFVEEVPPSFQRYEGALVHGAALPRLRSRLHYLIEQWRCGVRFSELYFLSGERPLMESERSLEALTTSDRSPLKIRSDCSPPSYFPLTECDLARWVWEQADVPEDFRDRVQVYFINAPMKRHPVDRTLLRPTTDDTVEKWLESQPPLGRYLAVSNSPFILRQDLVVRKIASERYCLDSVGNEIGEEEQVAVLLDELARTIFQTKACFTPR